MKKRLFAIIFIFICSAIAWFILGGITLKRTYMQDDKLRGSVGQMWGTAQYQKAPSVYYEVKTKRKVSTEVNDRTVEKMEDVTDQYPVNLESTDIKAAFDLDYRKKGLLWYSTYKVKFSAKYEVINPLATIKQLNFYYYFPTSEGVYDNFVIKVDGVVPQGGLKPQDGQISTGIICAPGTKHSVEIAYDSQGLDNWWYQFGTGVTQVKNFSLVMTTNFDKINFPGNSMSPSEKKKSGKGWELSWQYKNLLSGTQIGLEMPKKLNPGPFASQVSFFAPVSLFFFFFLMFIITAIKEVKIHPMNYFFLAASFFSFHLLMAYLADVVDIYLAFIIASVVSIFLVISYMRLVVGPKFAFVEVGISQFVYLVLFSSAFFLEGYTGLMVTILAIITLFVVMQVTGKVDWEKQFADKK